MKLKEPVKYFEVRFYPNATFKVVDAERNFHESALTDICSCYNGDTRESYTRLIAEAKNVGKARKKIAKFYFSEAKKELTLARKKFELFNKILSEC